MGPTWQETKINILMKLGTCVQYVSQGWYTLVVMEMLVRDNIQFCYHGMPHMVCVDLETSHLHQVHKNCYTGGLGMGSLSLMNLIPMLKLTPL